MISAVDLLKGIAVGAGMDVAEVEGANGGLHTNYEGKTQAAVDALTRDGYDFAYIHVEAPDEMGHQGSLEKKLKAIEYLDSRVIGPLVSALDKSGEEYRLLVMPDHPRPSGYVPIRRKMCPISFMTVQISRKNDWNYNEAEAILSGNYIPEGYKLMDKFPKSSIKIICKERIKSRRLPVAEEK